MERLWTLLGRFPHVVLGLLVLLIVATWFLRRPATKGAIGELKVRFAIWRHLDKNEYVAFHDVMLRTPDGATQIDHIIVSRHGVFVVETKNLRGWIFGSERDSSWTQAFRGKRLRFQNPLRQNFKHTRAVEQALQLGSDVVYPVIVFAGSARLKTAMPDNVMTVERFAPYIRRFHALVFDPPEVDRLVRLLGKKNLESAHVLRATHVKRIHSRGDIHAVRNCPRCGHRLVVKTATRGRYKGQRFWACSAFPACRFTQKIG